MYLVGEAFSLHSNHQKSHTLGSFGYWDCKTFHFYDSFSHFSPHAHPAHVHLELVSVLENLVVTFWLVCHPLKVLLLNFIILILLLSPAYLKPLIPALTK